MWRGRLIDSSHWVAPLNDCDVETWIVFNDFVAERKQSAELPFDLDRAKAGDEVEYMNACTWENLEHVYYPNKIDDGYYLIFMSYGASKPFKEENLRMKYPQRRIKNE